MFLCTWTDVKLCGRGPSIISIMKQRKKEWKRERERMVRRKKVFGVYVWLVSTGREVQLVPIGIGQLLMEALAMSAAADPRPWEKDGPVDQVTRSAKPRPTRKTFRDVEQAPSFHREPASLIERRNECCKSASASQQRTNVFVRPARR